MSKCMSVMLKEGPICRKLRKSNVVFNLGIKDDIIVYSSLLESSVMLESSNQTKHFADDSFNYRFNFEDGELFFMTIAV